MKLRKQSLEKLCAFAKGLGYVEADNDSQLLCLKMGGGACSYNHFNFATLEPPCEIIAIQIGREIHKVPEDCYLEDEKHHQLDELLQSAFPDLSDRVYALFEAQSKAIKALESKLADARE